MGILSYILYYLGSFYPITHLTYDSWVANGTSTYVKKRRQRKSFPFSALLGSIPSYVESEPLPDAVSGTCHQYMKRKQGLTQTGVSSSQSRS